jgi:beta-galactosidase
MRKISLRAFLILLLPMGFISTFLTTSACAPRDDNPRQKLLLDEGWRFYRGRAEGFTPLPQGKAIDKWRFKTSEKGEDEAMAAPGLDVSGWQETEPGSDVFEGKQGFAWFRTELGDLPPGPTGRPRIYFQSVDDNATVYVNGKLAYYHEGGDFPFEINLNYTWEDGGRNEMAVLVENVEGRGGIDGVVLYNRPALWQDDQKMRSVKTASVDFDDSGWEEVRVPHDFVVGGEFDPKGADKPQGIREGELWYDRDHGFKPKGVGWYRRGFELPAADEGKRIWLEFDGIYRNSDVWVNGHWLGHHWSGYTGFYYDITDAANFGGENVVTVRADADWDEGWWYEGGGIYRHAWLTKLDPLHVGHWGTFVTTPEVTSELAEVNIQTTVVNDSAESMECTLTSAVTDTDGNTVATADVTQSIPAGQEYDFSQDVTIQDPTLWSLENPYLYAVKTTVKSGGRVTDRYETPLGVRYFTFDGNGFSLNGKHVKINGLNFHSDFAGVGVALPDRISVYKMEKLKEMGANAFRAAHNPHTSEVLEACDRLGILVMNENRHMGDSEDVLATVESLVRRDRNHPSIVLWSMYNEGLKQGYEEATKQYKAMQDVVKRWDPTRPTIGPMGPTGGARSPEETNLLTGLANLTEVIDVRGFNPDNYDEYHALNPESPMVALETGYARTTRGVYANDENQAHLSSYDTASARSWRMVAETDYVAGGFVWNAMDNRGGPAPYDWPAISSQFGFMDTCAFPKDDYYYYQSAWSDETVLHLFPHWNWADRDESDQTIEVQCYTNCESVELFLNGESQGRQDLEPYSSLSWKVEWEPGVLQAKCYRDDTVVAETTRETTEEPAGIALEPDRSSVNADGEDVSLVKVSILDAQGRMVPTAGNEVQFTVEGPGEIIGVGNGDPSSHEADKADKRRAFNGLAMVIIQATKQPGLIQLTAESSGLQTAVVEITTVKAPIRPRVP